MASKFSIPLIRRRVTTIRVIPPQVAMIARQPYETIADLPLYDDGPQGFVRRRLTLRSFARLIGGEDSDWVTVPIGIKERVARMLKDYRWRPVVRPSENIEYLTNHRLPDDYGWRCPEPLRRAYGHVYSLLQVASEHDRLQVIAGLRQLFPETHQLCIVKNTIEADSVAKRLEGLTGRLLTVGTKPRSDNPWWHVDPVGTFEGRSVTDWGHVVFWDAELVVSKTALVQLWHMLGSRRIGFITRDIRKLNDLDRALIEGMFGPIIYRPEDIYTRFSTMSVAMLPAPTYPAGKPKSGLDRKRIFFWHNAGRNRLIAQAARAICNNDAKTLANLELDRAIRWLLNPESRPARYPSGPKTTAAIIVETPAHGRELAKELPGWKLLTDKVFDSAVEVVEGPVIVTLPIALRVTLLVDALIYAAGCGQSWFDELGPACPGVSPERILLVDVADDCDDQAVRDRRARQADYQWRGWSNAFIPREEFKVIRLRADE